jgi:hypothetical protein
MGAFSGKNMFQMLRKAHPTSRVFKQSKQRHFQYTETGPGARSAINQLLQRYNGQDKTPGQAVANQFSRECVALKSQWQKLARAIQKDPNTPPALKPHARYFASNDTFDAPWFQFALCELSKVINYIVYHRIIYTRWYWPY